METTVSKNSSISKYRTIGEFNSLHNAQLNAITPLLWFGNADGAVSFLRNAET
jgi:hypothetical protein